MGKTNVAFITIEPNDTCCSNSGTLILLELMLIFICCTAYDIIKKVCLSACMSVCSSHNSSENKDRSLNFVGYLRMTVKCAVML
jgi:hypothetical protein